MTGGRVRRAGAAVSVACLAACSAPDAAPVPPRTPVTTASSPSSTVTAGEESLRARVPESIRTRGTLRVRVDPTVAPFGLRGQDGSGHRGFEVELAEAVAARWGVAVSFVDVSAEGLLPGLRESTEDLAIGGLLVREQTRAEATFVLTLQAGVWWAVRAGNPKDLNPGAMCGQTVAVQSGTWARGTELVRREKVCERRGNPIRVRAYPGQDQATAALVSGKADALIGAGPAVEYAAAQARGGIETTGTEYFLGHGGIAVRRDDPGLAVLLAETISQLRRDGTYYRLLQRWGLTGRDGPVSVVR